MSKTWRMTVVVGIVIAVILGNLVWGFLEWWRRGKLRSSLREGKGYSFVWWGRDMVFRERAVEVRVWGCGVESLRELWVEMDAG